MITRAVRRAQARRDLIRYFTYLSEQASTEVAHRFLDAAERACALLAQSPELGVRRTFAHESLANVRMWPLPGFRECLLIYEPIPDGIRLVRVIHAKRDFRKTMR